MIQVQSGTDPLLRRPISLCGAGGETVEILFQVKGRGTELMAAWEPGRAVSLLGPLATVLLFLLTITDSSACCRRHRRRTALVSG